MRPDELTIMRPVACFTASVSLRTEVRVCSRHCDEQQEKEAAGKDSAAHEDGGTRQGAGEHIAPCFRRHIPTTRYLSVVPAAFDQASRSALAA